jgi:GNAT superfamily N-acetyltransferase
MTVAHGFRLPYGNTLSSASVSIPDTAAVGDAGLASSSNEFRVSVASPAEYADIEAFSRQADPAEVMSPLTAPLIAWFVQDNPCGPGFVVVARERATDELVGHFVFYRWTLTRRQSSGSVISFPSILYVRLYVRRDYRRRGVFAAMTRFGLGMAERQGIELAYTAPNPRSAAGFVKFGMARRGPLPFWIRPPVPGWSLVGRLGARAPGIDVEPRPAFDTSFEQSMPEALPGHVTVWSPRSEKQLNWRYTKRPDCQYKIWYLRDKGRPVGYLVTRRMDIKGRPALVICDCWAGQQHAGAIRAGVEAARRDTGRRAVTIAMGASAVPHLARAYRRAGFIRTPSAVLPQPVVIFGGGLGSEASDDDLPALDTWHVTPYDWDVF